MKTALLFIIGIGISLSGISQKLKFNKDIYSLIKAEKYGEALLLNRHRASET